MKIFRKTCDKIQSVISRIVNRLYEWYMRKRLINKDFTILCSNCIGGIIYHRLGLEFRSPTINLWMKQRDCIKLVSDIAKYKECELKFINSNFSYPVALLDDITIYFNHYTDESSAAHAWYRRISRINVDNMFLIIYDQENLSDAEIMDLQKLPCKGYIVLSDRNRLEVGSVKKVVPSKNPNGRQFLDRKWYGLHTFETQFDFVKWLNQ